MLVWILSVFAKNNPAKQPCTFTSRDPHLHGSGEESDLQLFWQDSCGIFGPTFKVFTLVQGAVDSIHGYTITPSTSSLTSSFSSLCSFTCSRWRMQQHLRALQRKLRRSRTTVSSKLRYRRRPRLRKAAPRHRSTHMWSARSQPDNRFLASLDHNRE